MTPSFSPRLSSGGPPQKHKTKEVLVNMASNRWFWLKGVPIIPKPIVRQMMRGKIKSKRKHLARGAGGLAEEPIILCEDVRLMGPTKQPPPPRGFKEGHGFPKTTFRFLFYIFWRAHKKHMLYLPLVAFTPFCILLSEFPLRRHVAMEDFVIVV